jgi:hypothetical protein
LIVGPSRDQCPRKHAVEALYSDFAEETDFRQVREPMGVIGISFVGGPVERRCRPRRAVHDRTVPSGGLFRTPHVLHLTLACG